MASKKGICPPAGSNVSNTPRHKLLAMGQPVTVTAPSKKPAKSA